MENIYYYFGLYFIVVIIKLAKLVKKYEPKDLRNNWTEILEVSLDLTFTASGCIIALLLNVDKGWIPVVYVLSTIILLMSAFMEFLSDRMLQVRPWLNGLVICIIVSGTFYLFTSVIPDVDNSGKKKQHTAIGWEKVDFTVIIPYKDETLIGNFGYSKIGNRDFLYKTIVSDTTIEAAKQKGIKIFESDSTISPVLKPKKYTGRKEHIKINYSEVVAFKK